MQYPMYQVDAFTNQPFKGNPAAICLLEKEWLPDKKMLLIAKENNLAETAFVKKGANGYDLKWFTPEIEMDLCGHATLATAHILFTETNNKEDEISFETLSGTLKVKRENGFYTMNLPSRRANKAELPEIVRRAFNLEPLETYLARDYLLVYKTREQVLQLNPDALILSNLDMGTGGIIVTAPGIKVDFVSRFFCPGASVFEDPVTGSAHCTLIPFWAERLNKKSLLAKQVSERSGALKCFDLGDRVSISGQAVTFFKGDLFLAE